MEQRDLNNKHLNVIKSRKRTCHCELPKGHEAISRLQNDKLDDIDKYLVREVYFECYY